MIKLIITIFGGLMIIAGFYAMYWGFAIPPNILFFFVGLILAVVGMFLIIMFSSGIELPEGRVSSKSRTIPSSTPAMRARPKPVKVEKEIIVSKEAKKKETLKTIEKIKPQPRPKEPKKMERPEMSTQLEDIEKMEKPSETIGEREIKPKRKTEIGKTSDLPPKAAFKSSEVKKPVEKPVKPEAPVEPVKPRIEKPKPEKPKPEPIKPEKRETVKPEAEPVEPEAPVEPVKPRIEKPKPVKPRIEKPKPKPIKPEKRETVKPEAKSIKPEKRETVKPEAEPVKPEPEKAEPVKPKPVPRITRPDKKSKEPDIIVDHADEPAPEPEEVKPEDIEPEEVKPEDIEPEKIKPQKIKPVKKEEPKKPPEIKRPDLKKINSDKSKEDTYVKQRLEKMKKNYIENTKDIENLIDERLDSFKGTLGRLKTESKEPGIIWSFDADDVQDAMKDTIAKAHHRIFMMYPWIRNIDVGILKKFMETESRIIVQEASLDDDASVELLKLLQEKDVKIRTMPHVHTIAVVSDDTSGLIISTDPIYESFEVGVIYKDQKSIEEIERLFEDAWEISQDVDLEIK
ncbi:MAG: hypothetical protein FGO69_01340 [Methanobacterium sp.]|nr:MAG: hypothetical protein FGO69_01340 [Methanobacterium sp.]